MKFLSRSVSAALAFLLLAGTAAAQTEAADRDLAKVRSELAATQKLVTEIRKALGKSQADEAAAQAKLADATRTVDILRKELESEKVRHGKVVTKLNAAIKEAGPTVSDRLTAQMKLAESINAAEAIRRKLESDNAQLVAAAAKLELVTKEAARTKAELVAVQSTLQDARLAKTQLELATAQKALAATKLALNESQAELAKAAKTQEILGVQVAAEKAQAVNAAAELARTAKEAARTNAELAAIQKTLMEAKQAKTQKELANNQQTLAEARAAADDLRKSLEAEIANSAARLEAAKREAALLKTDAETAAAKLAKEDAQTRAQLNSAEKTLALQPHLPATIVVTLPADAKLTFDDRPTTSTGANRVFISPRISVGPTFCYVLKATVIREGKTVTMQKHIEVRAGERIEVDLTPSDTESIDRP